MIALYLFCGFVAATFGLWCYYLIVMALKAARDAGRIPADMLRLCEIVATVGLLLDVAYNLVIATVFFADLPREATLTGRLIRYKRAGGWRGTAADYICRNLLDPFDDGCHCRLD
jgi:hypothetical protein